MEKETLDNRLSLAFNRLVIPEEKLLMGSISGKHPVRLKDGRTVVFINDKAKEDKIREKYETIYERMDFSTSTKKQSRSFPKAKGNGKSGSSTISNLG
jgi:hypothetical protein